MPGRERRAPRDVPGTPELRAGLTPAQQAALPTLERFGWTLRFVRRPLFRDPVPVLFDQGGERWVVLEADGSLDEAPDFQLRR
ncbi:hypothetical protein QFW77_16245 [Luteimonas sp. RD2P54]|uniref:DUF4224 domain-containing protein n=1 Tax=Luteimonas endophytica TaxID=3042023 RepID=A0ABT6JD70_9GAMM|nr:hypothetical protein [Luteimonas endophytica]MDH5824525.1 hypothetical protein [Luteimonas endophytica]